MEEIWKDIPDYEGIYSISNLGRIKSLARVIFKRNAVCCIKERLLTPTLGKRGYYTIMFQVDGKKMNRTIHQLLAIVFLDHTPANGLLDINHIDGNKTNNNLNNLEIVTHRENISSCLRNFKRKKLSQYVGVSYSYTAKKWVSSIRINGLGKHLGYFTNELEAHEAYNKALVDNNVYKLKNNL